MPINYDDYNDQETFQPSRKKRVLQHKNKQPLKVGRVISISPESFFVSADDQEYPCVVKGTLKKTLKQEKNRICPGDLVEFDPKKNVIETLKERTTVLERQNPSNKHQKQILATNVDQLLITSSIAKPDINPYLIDLYIMSAMQSQLRPVILVNKIDLLSGLDDSTKTLLKELEDQYQKLAIPFICISAKSKEGMILLKECMKEHASVFSGESGVGKSSLINSLLKSHLKVGDVSHKSSKGMHTTTSSTLLKLDSGGFCVDTPGLQSLGFNHLSPIEVRNAFVELINCGCKFQDCLHLGEKGCNIHEAIEKKEVSSLRLASYHRLLKEIESAHEKNTPHR